MMSMMIMNFRTKIYSLGISGIILFIKNQKHSTIILSQLLRFRYSFIIISSQYYTNA